MSFPRRTAVELAEALGVHRNTIGAWRAEGAPGDLDEWQWRTWAAARSATGRGYDCPKDPEPALFELLAAAGVGDYRDRLGRHLPVLGTGEPPAPGVPQAAPKEPTALTDEQRITRAKALTAEVEALDKQAASEQRRKQLVHVSDLHPLLDAWLQVLGEVWSGLDAIPQLCSASPDVQVAVRNALDTRVRALRAAIADQMEAKLKAYLDDLARQGAA